jgi:transposase
LLVSQGQTAPPGHQAWTQAGREELLSRAKPLADCAPLELWRGELSVLLARHRFLDEQLRQVESTLDRIAETSPAVQLLLSVPGVGVRTAEVIAAHLHAGRRFRTAAEVSAYAGLVPRQYQSGLTDRRGHISKRGPKLLRAALVECAWCSLRYNRWALTTWRRLVTQGVSKKKAIVALARKLLVRCWAILKSGQPWREPTAPAPTTATAAAAPATH